MAYGDVKGSKVGKRGAQAFDNAKLIEELAAEQDSNIEVGDFLADLQTAIKFRMRTGLAMGDWIEEPERFLTDGKIFAEEQATTADVKLQVTLSLDASTSMWMNRIMKHAGPAMIAIDRTIRKASVDMPGVMYQPFIFHETASRIPAAYLNNYTGSAKHKDGTDTGQIIWPNYPSHEQIRVAVEAGEISDKDKHLKLSGNNTRLSPLFQAISDWEKNSGDTSAVRLDIVLTDGVLGEEDDAGDVEKASSIQEDRNGRLRTVLLNFLPLDKWCNHRIPERCGQFAVTADNIDTSIRQILTEAINELF